MNDRVAGTARSGPAGVTITRFALRSAGLPVVFVTSTRNAPRRSAASSSRRTLRVAPDWVIATIALAHPSAGSNPVAGAARAERPSSRYHRAASSAA